MKVNFYPSNNQQTQNFKGIYLVQIPYKAFSEPQNEAKCLNIVRDLVLNSLRHNKSKVSGNNIPYFPDSNIVFQHDTFSHSLLNASMQKNAFCPPVQWIKDNTGIPVVKPLNENYHSFFIYTKHDAVKVKQQKALAQKNMQQSLNLDTQYNQYKDTIMKNILKDIHSNVLLGIEIDKRLQTCYRIAKRYVIGTLANLNDVAQKIRTNDIL